jgi:predicted DNA-binding protein
MDMHQNTQAIEHLTVNGTHQPALTPFPLLKQRVTVSLPTGLIERLRNAVYWTGHGSLVGLVAEAIEDIVTQMEDINGGAFPQRVAPLKRGRRQGKRVPAKSSETQTVASRIRTDKLS